MLGEKVGLADLRAKLIDLALHHPKLGIFQAKVPQSLVLMRSQLEERKSQKLYLKWSEYAELAASICIHN